MKTTVFTRHGYLPHRDASSTEPSRASSSLACPTLARYMLMGLVIVKTRIPPAISDPEKSDLPAPWGHDVLGLSYGAVHASETNRPRPKSGRTTGRRLCVAASMSV